MATGFIWVRYSMVITPVNYSLAAVRSSSPSLPLQLNSSLSRAQPRASPSLLFAHLSLFVLVWTCCRSTSSSDPQVSLSFTESTSEFDDFLPFDTSARPRLSLSSQPSLASLTPSHLLSTLLVRSWRSKNPLLAAAADKAKSVPK